MSVQIEGLKELIQSDINERKFMEAETPLPVEITEAFTDLGLPYYEWTKAGHNWLSQQEYLDWLSYDWTTYYTEQR